MKTIKNSRFVRPKVLLFASFLLVMCAGMTGAQTRQEPIDYFIGLLPDTTQWWNDPENGNWLFIDAYGKANNYYNLGLPTTIDGKVTIQTLQDGTVRYIVEGQTRNAICYGYNASFAPAFGFRPVSVQGNLGPASLGQAMWRFVYAPQTAGQFNVSGPQEMVTSSITCAGDLRYGSGYADFTPGFAQTRQTGLGQTGVPSGCPPERDGSCFPAEKVQFKPRVD